MSSKNVVDLRRAAAERQAREEAAARRSALGRPQESRSMLAQRSASKRSRRRKRWMIVLILILLLLGAAAYGISWASYLPKYSITQVSVSGTQEVPQQLVEQYIEAQLQIKGHPFISPDNVLRFNAAALERAIVGYFPRIATAEVSRASVLATAITVQVTERQPYALWCSSDTQTDCYYMDEGGFIFAQAPSQTVAVTTSASSTSATSTPQSTTSPTSATSGMYIFEGAISTTTSPIGQTFVGAHLPGIIALLQTLGQTGLTPLGATVQSDDDFTVPLAQGFYVKASFGEDSQQLVQNLQLVLSSDALQGQTSQLEYVDLRFGDRVYYKLNGQDQTQAASQ